MFLRMKSDPHVFSWDSPSELSSEEMQVEKNPANMLSFKALVTARKRADSVRSQALDVPRVSPAVRKRAVGVPRADRVRCQHIQTRWNKSFRCGPTGFNGADDLPRSDQPPVTTAQQSSIPHCCWFNWLAVLVSPCWKMLQHSPKH